MTSSISLAQSLKEWMVFIHGGRPGDRITGGPKAVEELVDYIRDRARDLENATLGHAEKLGMFAAKSARK